MDVILRDILVFLQSGNIWRHVLDVIDIGLVAFFLYRLFLLVHPHPDDPIGPWPHDGGMPVFGQSSLRAFNMQRSQSVYQDLLRLEKYNGRLQWRRRLGAPTRPEPVP